MNNKRGKKGLEMYFSPEVARKFAELEQNEKNFQAADIVDKVIMQCIAGTSSPIFAAELGGGAHPDRYHQFFKRLLQEPKGRLDWVDISPHMLSLADEYLTDEYQIRKEVIRFIESDIVEYLENLGENSLDLAVMKYTIDYVYQLDQLFGLLFSKLKPGRSFVSTLGSLSPELKSFSSNARYFYKGKPFPDDEIRILQDGDDYTIKFFKVSGDPSSGYLEGAETVKYYHSAEKIKRLAEAAGFKVFLGDWKDFVDEKNRAGEGVDQAILVLAKPK